MKFTAEQIKAACDQVAPKYGFDPLLIFAVCDQESAHDKAGNFLADIGRPETGYYSRYVEAKYNLATTSELLLSCSFGIMQLMGDSLFQLKYFEWYYDHAEQGAKNAMEYPLSEAAIPKALNWFCVHLEAMVEYGCQWLAKKRTIAGGDIDRMLLYWNGGSNKSYNVEVRAKWDRAKARFSG